MRTYKLLTLGAAMAIIALEAFLFSYASADAPDIGTTRTIAASGFPFTP